MLALDEEDAQVTALDEERALVLALDEEEAHDGPRLRRGLTASR